MSGKRILFVFAHPDDETFTSGATIAHYSRLSDCDIHLLCATRGEAGKTGHPPQCRPEELAEVREKELQRAADVLGIEHVELLDYHDGKLSNVPTQELSGHIQDYLKKFDPQIVITFPPHGISGHKDHRAIQKATFHAVAQFSKESPRKLYYPILPESIKGTLARAVHTDPDEAVDVVIDAVPYHEQVARALREHKTQNMSVNMVFPGVLDGDYTSLRKKNFFHLAWTNIPESVLSKHKPDTDLFTDIDT
ncbi:MAG: PIG-L family deacetylase [Bacillaceae bacterium]|nr:PIG-L family deacetylase [Bacillaceae bacterium]